MKKLATMKRYLFGDQLGKEWPYLLILVVPLGFALFQRLTG
jgi:hypothetical protein